MKQEQEVIDEEILINGSRKINIGIRAYPELKKKLTEEANELGYTLSEHAENILLNKDNLQSEKNAAAIEIEVLKEQVLKLNGIIVSGNAESKTRFEKLIKENTALQENSKLLNDQLTSLKENEIELGCQLALFKDKKLLELFEKLRGTTAVIKTTDNQTITVTYNTPGDLLKVLIYSFKLKK